MGKKELYAILAIFLQTIEIAFENWVILQLRFPIHYGSTDW